MFKKMLIYFSALVFLPALIYAAATDYLILQDILPYKLFTGIAGRVFSGPPSKYSQTNTGGLLDMAGHFAEGDTSYDASYTEPGGKWPFVKVEVTQHAGSDSDKWLLHEVEDGYRDDDNLNATIDTNVQMRTIDGKNVYFIGIYGAKSYTWLANNNTVVNIGCSSCPSTKPEPLEIVKAYLTKFPSTIPLTNSDLKSRTHSEQWIKDEMDRRLWLCDKWFAQLGEEKTDQKTALTAIVKSMNVFLDYREKYYGVKAAEEKNLLIGYLNQNDSANIQAKLTAYKTWWTANKGNSIMLP